MELNDAVLECVVAGKGARKKAAAPVQRTTKPSLQAAAEPLQAAPVQAPRPAASSAPKCVGC